MKTNRYLLLLVFSSILFSSCKKEDTKNSSDYPYYFTATINGAAVKYEADDLNSLYGCGTSQPEESIGFDNYDIYALSIFLSLNFAIREYLTNRYLPFDFSS